MEAGYGRLVQMKFPDKNFYIELNFTEVCSVWFDENETAYSGHKQQLSEQKYVDMVHHYRHGFVAIIHAFMYI